MRRSALAALCLAVLAAGAARAQAPALPPEIAAFAAERSAECKGFGGTPRIGPAFATPVDLTGDGATDYVVDLAGVECANAWSAFCGSSGCPVSVWIAGAEGLRQEWSDYAQGWTLDPAGAEIGLMIDRHGTACPGAASGADGCRERKVFAAAPAPAPVAVAPEPVAASAPAPVEPVEPSPAAAAVALAAPASEGWSLRRAEDGSEVAVTGAPGAFATIAVFCLSGQPWLAATPREPFGAETAQIEFVFSRGSASGAARREDGAGGALVIELADRPLIDLLAGRDSSAQLLLDGAEQGVLSLRGSTKAIRAAVAACVG